MLDDLKTLFSSAWASFLREVGRRDPEDQVAELLGAMRREMVDARANLPVYEEEHRRAGLDLQRERKMLEDTVRRRGMAERIGDAETVRVADEFAARHHDRIRVLEEKVKAAKDEWDLRVRESQDMLRRYKEADANRFALLAEMRRAGARETIGGTGNGGATDDAFRTFDRTADDIDSRSAYDDALRELTEDMEGGTPPPQRPSASDVDDKLRELKRRMGRE
jgi:phage shock protein A